MNDTHLWSFSPSASALLLFQDQNGTRLPAEVAVMLKLSEGSAGSVGTSVSVSLLDWYHLDQELILVLERPVPCEDLFLYIMCNGGPLPEAEAKVSYWGFLCVLS